MPKNNAVNKVTHHTNKNINPDEKTHHTNESINPDEKKVDKFMHSKKTLNKHLDTNNNESTWKRPPSTPRLPRRTAIKQVQFILYFLLHSSLLDLHKNEKFEILFYSVKSHFYL